MNSNWDIAVRAMNRQSHESSPFFFFYIFGPHRPRAIAFVDHGTLSLYHGCKDKDLKRQIAEWMMPDDTVDQFGLVTIGQQLHHDILLFPAPQQMKVPEGHAAFHLAALKTLQHFNRFWDPTSLSFHITGSGEDALIDIACGFWSSLLSSKNLRCWVLHIHCGDNIMSCSAGFLLDFTCRECH